jgi:hypothetical protein
MISYILLVPLSLLLTLVAIIIAPVLPMFAVQKEWWLDNHSYRAVGPVLPSWLNWFMTPDNSLDGDATFEKLNPPSYWSKVKWLWRNPAYAFALRYLDAPYTTEMLGDKTIKDNDNAKKGWLFVKANGLFQFVLIVPIGFQRCFMVNLGWNVRALVDDNVVVKPNPYQATFVFSPRISGFR